MNSLDILKWWSSAAIRCPIVSKMTKYLLIILTFTVALVSTFLAGSRVLNDKSCKLSEKFVEASVCLKYWYDAVDLLQNLNLKDESEDEETKLTLT